MALYHSPSIVTNGLVLYLDAANPRSYPGSGTTWFDLSGNGNNGTLTNGPTFNSSNNGNILFDGVNDNIYMPYSINTGQNFTASVWCRKNGGVRAGLIANSYPYTINIGWYFFIGGFGQSNNLTLAIGNDQIYANTPPNAFNNNQWYNFSVVVINGGNNISFYINGILQNNDPAKTVLNSASILYTNSTLYLGALPLSPSDYLVGNISNTLIYNRSLSATEIAQNFNATRGRFGI